MTTLKFKEILAISGQAILAMAWFASAGCSKQADPDLAPLAIRGQPINSAPATNARIVEVARAIATPALATNLPANASTASATPSQGDPFTRIGFDKLAGYLFDVPDDLLAPASNQLAQATAKTEAQIPADVKAFDKKRVALKGFMLPLKVEGGKVSRLQFHRACPDPPCSIGQGLGFEPHDQIGHGQGGAQGTGRQRYGGADIRCCKVEILDPAILIGDQQGGWAARVRGHNGAQGQHRGQAVGFGRLKSLGHLGQIGRARRKATCGKGRNVLRVSRIGFAPRVQPRDPTPTQSVRCRIANKQVPVKEICPQPPR